MGKVALYSPPAPIGLCCPPVCMIWHKAIGVNTDLPMGFSHEWDRTVQHHSPGYIALAQMYETYVKTSLFCVVSDDSSQEPHMLSLFSVCLHAPRPIGARIPELDAAMAQAALGHCCPAFVLIAVMCNTAPKSVSASSAGWMSQLGWKATPWLHNMSTSF